MSDRKMLGTLTIDVDRLIKKMKDAAPGTPERERLTKLCSKLSL